ncbi:MAG TPA: ABC transporter permease [Bryobacteraceae bacterium]|nr:ABC transporter permease [Bryobacteraceae bacterium]
MRRRRMNRAVAEDIESHIEEIADGLMETGVPEREARLRARREFGNAALLLEESRAVWGWVRLERALQDLRHGLRLMARNPGFTAIAVLSLALGIGANTAIFTVTDALLLKQLPVEKPERLVVFAGWDDSLRQWTYFFTYREFKELQRRMQSFSGIAASWTADRTNIVVNGAVDEAPTHIGIVSGNYFSVLGVRPAIGRSFAEDEPAAVISHSYWERRFGSRPDILGRTLGMNGVAVTIAGVAPDSFMGDSVGQPLDVWIPITLAPHALFRWSQKVDNNPVRLIARLKPQVAAGQAEAEAKVVYRQIAHELGRLASENPARLALLPEGQGISRPREHYRQPLAALTVIAGLILLLACANAANLLLTRSEARRKEFAVRLALGAGRGRIVGQLLVESLMLAVMSGAAGLALAWWGTAALMRLARTGPWAVELHLRPDGRVLAYTAALCLLTGVLFGLAPALSVSKVALYTAVKGAARTPGRFPLGRLLVVVQVGLSLILLMGAGLFVRTLRNLKSQDLGFDREHLLLVRTDAAAAGQGKAVADVYQEIARIPGVRSVSASHFGMLRPAVFINVTVAGHPMTKPADRVVAVDQITPRFLETVGMHLLAGREFTPRDMTDPPRTAIVNQAMARRFFGTTDVVGRRFAWGEQASDSQLEIVGVIRDAAYNTLRNRSAAMIYMPEGADWQDISDATLVVRTATAIPGIGVQIRDKFRTLAPGVTVRSTDWMDDAIDQWLSTERMVAWIAGLFGALALVLACLGLYGMMSYVTARRTSEIGIRMSLGATPARVIRMVLGYALTLGVAGVVLGVPAALAESRLVTGLLFGVGAQDVATVAGAALIMLAVVVVAAWLPARRAASIDALKALRCE